MNTSNRIRYAQWCYRKYLASLGHTPKRFWEGVPSQEQGGGTK